VVEIRAWLAADGVDGSGYCELFGEGQEMEVQKCAREMRRGGKHSGAQHAAASARLDEIELAMEAGGDFDAEAAIEVEQIHAAFQENVLAIVDGVGAGLVGSRAAAEKRSRFEKAYFVACARESCGCG